MQNATTRGIGIGLLVVLAAWIGDISGAPGRVSTFPDVLSLLILVVLTAISFRGPLGAGTRSAVARTAARLGTWAGAIVGVSTGIRGLMRWSHPRLTMVAIAVVGSFLVVLLVASVVALIADAAGRRRQSVGA